MNFIFYFFNAYASAIISPTIFYFLLLLVFQDGITILHYRFSKLRISDKPNVINSTFIFFTFLLCMRMPKVSTCPPYKSIPAIIRLISTTLSYLYLNGSSVLTKPNIFCKCLLSKLLVFIIPY